MARNSAVHPVLSDEAVTLVATRFRVLGDPTRLRLLNLLLQGEVAVLELVSRTGLGQPTVSKHLGVLLREGIVARRQQGTQAFYRVADASVAALCDLVCEGLATRLSGHLDALPARARGMRRARRARA
jgi:DNA-binding transcriptional ArsR family regulator